MDSILLFFFLLQLVTGEGESLCRPEAYKGHSTGADISSSCTSFEQAFATSCGRIAAIHMYRYTLGNNTCSVYEGSNKNGVLLGTFTGDGSATGIVKSNTGSMYLSCAKTRGDPFGAYFAFIEVTEEASCDLQINVDDLPTTLVLPTLNNGKLLPYMACNYTLFSPVRSNFTVSISDFDGKYGNGLYIVSDDPSHPGIFVDDPQVMKVQARRVSVLLFTYAFAPPSPTIYIESDMIQAGRRKKHEEMVCSSTVKLNVGSQVTSLLQSMGDDILYISNETKLVINSLHRSCKAPASNPLFEFDLNDCSPNKKMSNVTLSYVYEVRNFRSDQVVRRISQQPHWEVSCNYPATVKVGAGTVSTKLVIDGKKTSVGSQKLFGNFSVGFELFDDEQMETPLTTESTVKVPQYIYGKVSKLTPNIKLSIQLKSCWITRVKNLEENKRYDLIRESCKVVHGSEVGDAIVVTRNYQPTFADFKFRSFVWHNVSENLQTLFAHCYIQLCDNTNDDCPQLDCPQGRQRRSLRERPDEVISVGPFYVTTDLSCGQGHGGCSHYCNDVNGIVQCSCFKDYFLDEDGKTCTGMKEELGSKGFHNREIVYIAVGVIVLLLLSLLVLIVRILRGRFFKNA